MHHTDAGTGKTRILQRTAMTPALADGTSGAPVIRTLLSPQARYVKAFGTLAAQAST